MMVPPETAPAGHIPGSLLALVLDPSGRILFASASFAHLVGISSEQLRGEDWFATFVSGDDEHTAREFISSREEGASQAGLNLTLKGAARPMVVRWFPKPILGPRGESRGALLVGLPLTPGPETPDQEALDPGEAGLVLAELATSLVRTAGEVHGPGVADPHEAETRFQTLFQSSALGIGLVDLQGCYIETNPAFQALTGYPAEELARKSFEDLTHPDDLYADRRLFEELVAGRREWYWIEKRLITQQGRTIHVHASVSLGRKAGDNPLFVIRAVEDITERKQVEQAIVRRMKIEGTISAISSRFVTIRDLDGAVDETLTDLGYLTQAGRCYLVLFTDSHPLGGAMFEWQAPELPPHPEKAPALERRSLPWITSRLMDGEPLAVESLSALPRQARVDKKTLAAHDVVSCLLVPVFIRGELAGILGLDARAEPRDWSEEETSVLRIAAEIVGNALDRRQAELAERAARWQSELLRQALAALTSELNPDEVLERILIYLEKVIAYDSAAVLLLEGDHLRVVAGRGFPNPEAILGKTFPSDRPLLRELQRTFHPICLEDAQADPRFQSWGETNYVRGWMAVPLLTRGELIGYLTIDSREVGAYGPDHVDLAQTFANQASIAILNARLFEQVGRLAITDSLTGLFNRRHFFELAEREIQRARRYQHPLSAIMLDIDYFKQVNDAFGHAIGDQVLAEIAHRLQEMMRTTDILGRYGGEEFVVLLPETDRENARQVAERLRRAISEPPIQPGSGRIRVTASLGVAALTDNVPDIDALLERADQALYAAKQIGRDRVWVWGAEKV